MTTHVRWSGVFGNYIWQRNTLLSVSRYLNLLTSLEIAPPCTPPPGLSVRTVLSWRHWARTCVTCVPAVPCRPFRWFAERFREPPSTCKHKHILLIQSGTVRSVMRFSRNIHERRRKGRKEENVSFNEALKLFYMASDIW